jgi:hypothetical protein
MKMKIKLGPSQSYEQFNPTLLYTNSTKVFNPLNAELNPICYLLALLGAHHILQVSRIRVKIFTHLFSHINISTEIRLYFKKFIVD